MEANEGSQVPMYSAADAERDVDLVSAVTRVLGRRRYVLGEEVRRFESAFAEYCGTDDCIGVANGTDALEIALRAIDVGPADKVAVVANAGGYSSAAVQAIGAVPVYVDIDPRWRTMSATSLEALAGEGVAAIIATHLYGQLADIDAINAVARRWGVPVIEDCAQAHGARRNSRRAGSLGTIGCFSFYPTKNLGAAGDGGALVTSDAQLARRMRSLRQYGWSDKYRVETVGGRNSRLDEMQAAILNDKLAHLDRWNDERRQVARSYSAAFADLPIGLPASLEEGFVAHLFVVEADDRDALRDSLSRRGVATDIHYPLADHLQPAWASSEPVQLPATERACARVLSLPCYPGISDGQVQQVIDAVSASLSHAAPAAR